MCKPYVVLCIEDDPAIADAINAELRSAGLIVDWVASGAQADVALREKHYDIITLDWILPDCEGLALLKKIRQEGITTPVIMISGRGSVSDRVAGLKAGCDDYITKPFAPEEMIARIEVILRRYSEAEVTDTFLCVGKLKLDLVNREAVCNGKNILLKGTEFKLLEFMMKNRGRLITRSLIFEEVWGYDFDPGTKLIDVHLSSLRRKLDELDSAIQINNVRGAGFVLENH